MNTLVLNFQRNGESLASEAVVCRFRKNWSDQEVVSKTDENGKVIIDVPSDEISSLEVAGVVVRQNWYIEGGKEECFSVPDPTQDPGVEVLPASGWYLVKIKIDYDTGEPASGVRINFILKSGGIFSSEYKIEAVTNSDGWVRIHIDQDIIESIEVSGVVIKENWYIGSSTEEYIKIPKPGTGGNFKQLMHTVEGQLYYFDGTQPYQEIPIIIKSVGAAGERRIEGFSDSKGRFNLEIPDPVENRFLYEFLWYVSGEKIDHKRIHFANNFATIVLPEINFIGKGGLDGGVITGRVVDDAGEGIESMQVSGRVRTGSFVSSTFATNYIETKTNKRGYFALGFTGGIEIEDILVEGKPPKRIYKKRVDKSSGGQIEVDIESPYLRAGSFNIQLEASWKMFGSF